MDNRARLTHHPSTYIIPWRYIQEIIVNNNVEDEIVDEWVNITNEKMENYQELVDQLNGCLKDLHKNKEAEIRKKEDYIQRERFKRRLLEELKIEEMKPETKKENEDKGKTVNRNIQVKRAKLVITKFEGIHLKIIKS